MQPRTMHNSFNILIGLILGKKLVYKTLHNLTTTMQSLSFAVVHVETSPEEDSVALPFVEGLESLFSGYSQEGMQHASISRLCVKSVQPLSLHLEPCLRCVNGKRTWKK